MDWRVIFSERSRNDPRNIVAYIANDDAGAAGRFGERLIEAAESLRIAPKMGSALPERPGARFLVETPYLIIYRVDPVRREIRILRFWHGARKRRPLRFGCRMYRMSPARAICIKIAWSVRASRSASS
jgi:plasmid stabilization system protein ParE